jgi:hypothetical protein
MPNGTRIFFTSLKFLGKNTPTSQSADLINIYGILWFILPRNTFSLPPKRIMLHLPDLPTPLLVEFSDLLNISCSLPLSRFCCGSTGSHRKLYCMRKLILK